MLQCKEKKNNYIIELTIATKLSNRKSRGQNRSCITLLYSHWEALNKMWRGQWISRVRCNSFSQFPNKIKWFGIKISHCFYSNWHKIVQSEIQGTIFGSFPSAATEPGVVVATDLYGRARVSGQWSPIPGIYHTPMAPLWYHWASCHLIMTVPLVQSGLELPLL